MTTYLEARAAVTSLLIPDWTDGELATAATGLEDDGAFVVPFGNARFIRGGDPLAMVPDDRIAVVDKATGEARIETELSFGARADSMSETT